MNEMMPSAAPVHQVGASLGGEQGPRPLCISVPCRCVSGAAPQPHLVIPFSERGNGRLS